MRHKLLWRLLGVASQGPYTRQPSHGVPPLAGVPGHPTRNEEDSCGYFAVKTVRSIEWNRFILFLRIAR
jgi:hypothetical protein